MTSEKRFATSGFFSLSVAFALIVVSCGTSSSPSSADGGSGGSSGSSGAGTSSTSSSGGTGSSGGSGSGGSSGSSGSSGGDDASADAQPGQAATITAFDKTLFAFNGAPGGKRRSTVNAAFPAGGTYQSIMLHVQLDCPSGGCDHWDRTASLGIVTQAPADGGIHGTVLEIARWITPFGVAVGWDFDVTDLAPLLRGNVVLQGFVDTWSPQGSPAQNGAGWLLTTTFTFTPGTPAKTPIANIPIWTWPADSDPHGIPYGDPSKPLASYMKPQTLTLPAGATSYAVRSFITGHGQGNSGNCAEFCKAMHTITVGSQPFAQTPWRPCCTPYPQCELQNNPTPAKGVAPGQLGTYQFARSGWCPGAAVDAWTQDVTAGIGAGSTATFTYGLDGYTNLCRSDINDAGTCNSSECVLGTGCAYDGANHTEPQFYVTSLLVAYQ